MIFPPEARIWCSISSTCRFSLSLSFLSGFPACSERRGDFEIGVWPRISGGKKKRLKLKRDEQSFPFLMGGEKRCESNMSYGAFYRLSVTIDSSFRRRSMQEDDQYSLERCWFLLLGDSTTEGLLYPRVISDARSAVCLTVFRVECGERVWEKGMMLLVKGKDREVGKGA